MLSLVPDMSPVLFEIVVCQKISVVIHIGQMRVDTSGKIPAMQDIKFRSWDHFIVTNTYPCQSFTSLMMKEVVLSFRTFLEA